MSSLYLEHFGLSKPPFQITPDLDFFFSGGRRGDILSALLHVAAHDEGIITLVAEVGSGKTLLARLMISRLGAAVCAVYLANPCFSRDEIIAAIGRDLGLTDMGSSIEGKLALLRDELLRRHAAGQRVLLVIDEAHAMPAESLEEVRLLSNLETGQHKLVNIMLFGQPELDGLLAEPRLRQVRDRVIHRFVLPPLQADEASAYIDHRLRAAGWHGARLFGAAALARLVKASEGRARRINLLADKALLAAYAQGARGVEGAHVASAVQELPVDRPAPAAGQHERWRMLATSLALALLMTTAAIAALGWYRSAAPTLTAKTSAPPATTPTAPTPPTVPANPAAIQTPPAIPASTVAPPVIAIASNPVNAAPPVPPAVPVPAPPLSTDLQAVLERTQTWLRRADLDGYTIQLAALPSTTGLDAYLAQVASQADAAQMYAQHSVYKGKTYVSVYLGNFDSHRAAALVIEGLPADLKNNRPLVRTWTKIKQDQKP
ncbi:ExeA family protein [Rhodoferax sp.]|uniref:ExeA family protein n=1 Tax=Rhodoferax sp. TaxID=50421 RepID=UPI0027547FAB|nr:AAA family ATPase [Rhodoferax sp.]